MSDKVDVLSNPSASCPCGSAEVYDRCCGVYHRGQTAPGPEALMRSRYSAYVLRLEDYLLQSWHPSRRPVDISLPGPAELEWLGLKVRRVQQIDSDHATVAFEARCRSSGKRETLRELSRFVREDACWYYLDGDLLR